jgi:2-polyprenyl-3-methyl-5-hydroxy-6-metoxy-1,4-benzoquinol methylase
MDKQTAKAAQEFARLWGGFRASRVILTANNLGVFEGMGTGRSAAELAGILRTDGRATEILLDAIAALGLLRKSGATYRLTAAARRFLLPGSPVYQGDMLRHAETLWQTWSGLDDVVRTGRPNRSGSRCHDVFIRAMHNNAVMRAGAVIGALDLRGVKQALDLGGGPGTYSIALAKRGINVTLFDLPNTLDVSREMVRRSGVKTVILRGGDFHFDDLGGPYDLILISQVLHSHSAPENRALLAKANAALAPGGVAAVHEFLLKENRAAPAPGALFSVNMLVNTAEGRSYTPKEVRSWLNSAGFMTVRARPLGDTVLVTGRKRKQR